MAKIEKTVKSNVVYDGKILRLNCDDVEAANGQIVKREIIHHHGGVCILAIHHDKVVMVKQFRYSYGEEMFELPAVTLSRMKKEDLFRGSRMLFFETDVSVGSIVSVIHADILSPRRVTIDVIGHR